MKGDLCYCNNIYGLFSAFNIDYDVSERRLFIDASKYSIKAVLLHNGNRYPSIPIVHSMTLKKTYENLRFILDSIQYDYHKWSISADLKFVVILTGLQSGCTKYCCFLCLWDSHDRKEHYCRKEWPVRNTHIPDTNNIKNPCYLQSKFLRLVVEAIMIQMTQYPCSRCHRSRMNCDMLGYEHYTGTILMN